MHLKEKSKEEKSMESSKAIYLVQKIEAILLSATYKML